MYIQNTGELRKIQRKMLRLSKTARKIATELEMEIWNIHQKKEEKRVLRRDKYPLVAEGVKVIEKKLGKPRYKDWRKTLVSLKYPFPGKKKHDGQSKSVTYSRKKQREKYVKKLQSELRELGVICNVVYRPELSPYHRWNGYEFRVKILYADYYSMD